MSVARLSFLLALAACGDDPVAPLAGHDSVGRFAEVSSGDATAVRQLQVLYGHTSHGSQLLTGMELLGGDYADHAFITELSGDLGHLGDLTWETMTRAELGESGNGYDVVIWSWCGGVSDNTVAGIDTYLAAMSQLEVDYPAITFVYMTGHLDGSGADGNLRLRNQQIRDYCQAHGKVLFDFEDIESWDPAGVFHVDDSDACNWCTEWCTAHPLDCVDLAAASCAHSHPFNCLRKGKAFWWLLDQLG